MTRPAVIRFRTRRWAVQIEARAVHIDQRPDPDCLSCHGDGGWWDNHPTMPDPVDCPCWGRSWRIPLRPATGLNTEPPF